jgi:uncharacterized protein (TIGR02996 family)
MEDLPAALQAAIVASPDSPAPYLVASDWLQQRNDPHGELIALDFALDSRSGDAALRQRVEKMREEHHPLPPGVDRTWWEFHWRWGFIRQARLWVPLTAGSEGVALRRCLRSPIGRFMQKFSLAGSGNEPDVAAVIQVLAEEKPPALEALVLGVDALHPPGERPARTDVSALWPALPKLRTLAVHALGYASGTIVLPRLAELSMHLDDRADWGALGRAQLPRLESLRVWAGDLLFPLRDLVTPARFPALRHLGLLGANRCAPVSQWPIVRQLEVLDLSLGTFNDADASAFAADRERLAHLRLLDLSDTELSSAGCPMVSTLAREVRAFVAGLLVVSSPSRQFAPGAYVALRSRGGEFVIGRAADVDLPLRDDAVARRHTFLRRSFEGRWRAADSGSTNGTLVNGERIREVPLRSGDELRIGRTVFRFVEGEVEAEVKALRDQLKLPPT